MQIKRSNESETYEPESEEIQHLHQLRLGGQRAIRRAPGLGQYFVDRLHNHLEQELPCQYHDDGIFWLDYEQLRGIDSVTASIRSKLEASRILLPILSRSYLDSP